MAKKTPEQLVQKIRKDVKSKSTKKILPSGLGQVEFPKDLKVPDVMTTDYEAEFPLFSSLKSYGDIFGQDFFIINDIPLAGIPSIDYSFDSENDTLIAETLRSKSPIVTSKGTQNWTLNINFVFKPGDEQKVTLRRLVGELSRNPIVYIYNRRVREALGIPDEDNINTMFILENAQLVNAAGGVGDIVLALKMHFFNYKPFSNHFWFNSRMPNYKRPEGLNTVSKKKKLLDTTGYEDSAYRLNNEAKAIAEDIRTGAAHTNDKPQVPVPFPASSDAYVYYANYLESLTPEVSRKTGDFLSLKIKYYSQHQPPVTEASLSGVSAGMASQGGPELKKILPVYNAFASPQEEKTYNQKNTQDRISGSGATQEAATEIVGDAIKNVKIFFAKQGKSITIDLTDENGNIPDDTHLRISELAANPDDPNQRSKRAKKKITTGWQQPPERFLKKKVIFALAKVARRWPGKKIRIKSGIRNYGWASGPHATGKAVDFAVQGVSEKDLFLFCATNLDLRYCEYAPVDKFVHIDPTNKKNWAGTLVELTNKGANDEKNGNVYKQVIKEAKQMIASGKKYYPLSDEPKRKKPPQPGNTAELAKEKRQLKKEEEEHIKDEAEAAEIQANEQLRSGSNVGDANYGLPDPELQQVLDSADPNKKTVQSKQLDGKRDPEIRKRWIDEMFERHQLHYYLDDPKIRNMFYTNVAQDIGVQENNNRGGIIMTGISVSFGHRIVPQRLLSQDTYTWQFLGAGNRQGTMSFRFSGPDGRLQADRIKQIIYGARENARKFGSIIQDAGSIEVDYINPKDGTRTTALALLNINNIVVTDINEKDVKGITDTYDMVISFVVQEFQEEKLEQRFVTEIDRKRKVFAKLMSFITKVDQKDAEVKISRTESVYAKDRQYIQPKSKYVKGRINRAKNENKYFEQHGEFGPGTGFGRPYVLSDKNMPVWLANIIIDTANLCREIDHNMPPSEWYNDGIETWKDIYKKWGDTEGIIKGRIYNISPEDIKVQADAAKNPAAPQSTRQKTWQEERMEDEERLGEIYTGSHEREDSKRYQIVYDNGSDFYRSRIGNTTTNKKHEILFKKWQDGMDSLYDRLMKNLADEETFERYFNSLSEEIYNSITQDLGSCYADMDIPDVPLSNGMAMPLPPEFYIYDDSKEDPAFSLLTDNSQYNTKKMLEEHMDNEINSLEHMMYKSALGGSYLSAHLPQIINDRKRYLEQLGGDVEKDGLTGELKFINSFDMLEEGCATWEPLFHRSSDDEYKQGEDTESAKAWYNNVLEKYSDSKDPDEARFAFMDKITKLSPYLDSNNHPAWDMSHYSDSYTIERIYDENWKALSFGPNAENSYADEVLNGTIPSKNSTKNAERSKQDSSQTKASSSKDLSFLDLQKKISKKALSESKTFQNKEQKATYLSTGEILLGESKLAEKTRLRKETIDNAKDTAFSAAKTYGKYNIITGPVYWVAKGIKTAGSAVINSFSNEATEEYLEKYEQTILDNVHPVSSKFGGNEAKKVAELSSGIAFASKAKDLSVRRAFPAFKIYFIEDDSHQTQKIEGNTLRAFDDFYSYSAIQEIRISRNRKIAADYAVIRMTNIGGKLLRRRFGEDELAKKPAEYSTGIFADTDKENPFETMILQEGVKVQIRLGYANEPDNLESVFLGSIVEIMPSEEGKIIEIHIQGFGAELENVELGPLQDGPEFYSTQSALSAAITTDSIVNFGRRSKFNKFNPGEVRSRFVGGQGHGVLASISPVRLVEEWGSKAYGKHLYRYPFRNLPQDDNIFAPPPKTYANTWQRFWNNACIFRPIKQTPWEIFKEHELRHPGYISMAVPYGHSPRMTMFFGAKAQHYWSKPPSQLELHLAQKATDLMVQMRGMNMQERMNDHFLDKLDKLSKKHPKLGASILQGLTTFSSPANVGREIGRLFGRYKPFRNYHFLDSYHHILKNEIRTSSDGTFNEVEVLYFEEENKIQEGDQEKLYNNIATIETTGQKFSTKLDENIPESHIRSYVKEFPSCITEFMAKRYAQGLFAKFLRDAYKGELIVLGDATIKPYDICYMHDSTINMTGPFEVEGVEHIINRDHGWISILTPDLCVDINEFFSASVFDVTGSALANLWAGGNTGGIMTGVTALAIPFSTLALMGGVKFGLWMQDGSPVLTTPLTLGGKPFLSINIGQDRISLIQQYKGKISQWWDDYDELKFDIGESLFNTSISIQEKIYSMGSGHTEMSKY